MQRISGGLRCAMLNLILSMHEDREHISYHALAVHLQSNYRAMGRLREQCASWEEALQEHESTADPHGRKNPETLFEELARHGITLLLKEDPDYPPLLREIPWSPFGVYYKSALQKLAHPVAVVGTRKATSSGKEYARSFSADLARAGCAIVSGLAFGIDAAAHDGALSAQGMTVAVLGNGVDAVYPRSNESLAKKILDAGGALLSEYPPGAPSLPHRFLERNRIISGLSLGVLVVEAPRDSGARATARFAVEQNRDVFVVPGPANHPNFEGSHELIRQGAELVTSAAHVCESLGIASAQLSAAPCTPRTPEEGHICAALASAGTALSIDKLIELTTLNPQTVTQTLTYLLLRGIVREDGEGYIIA